MTDQAPGFYRRSAGGHVVTAINDGYLDLPFEAMTGIDAAEAGQLLAAQFHRASPRSAVNTYLVQGGGRTVLIDTGGGHNMVPSLGRLLQNLAAAGVQPGDIDLVLLTHLHPDHSGNLAQDAGTAVFPKAELVLSEAESGFWLGEAAMQGAPEGRRPYHAGAQAAVAPYKSRTTLFRPGEVAPGITAVPLPGHTPGHTGYRIGDGDDALLVWGDVMHVPDVQSVRPEVGMAYDVEPDRAIETRRRVLDMVATERLAVAGMHLHFPGFARVARSGTGYAMIPESWTPEV